MAAESQAPTQMPQPTHSAGSTRATTPARPSVRAQSLRLDYASIDNQFHRHVARVGNAGALDVPIRLFVVPQVVELRIGMVCQQGGGLYVDSQHVAGGGRQF